MTIGGYVASIGYLAAIILLFGFINKKFKVDVEITRKILHILIGFTWVIMDLFWHRSYHQIIMCAIFVIVNAFSRKYKIFNGIERQKDDHPGTVYYALSMLILAVASFIYEPLYMPFGLAVACLSFGDGFAPIVAYVFKKRPVKLVGNKTLWGTAGCFVFSAVAMVIINICYRLDYSYLSIFAIASVVATVELFCGKGLDNFGVPFSVTLLAWIIKAYSVSDEFLILTICSFAIIIAVALSKSLTAPADFLAYVILIVSSASVGYKGFLLYVVPFFITAIVGYVRKEILKKRGLAKEKNRRNAEQVLINGFIALIFIIAYGFTLNDKLFVLGALSLAEAFADSMASDVGSLSTRKPYDIFKLKKVDVGISGGVSLLGSFSALTGSVIVGLFAYWKIPDWRIFGFVVGLSFFGTLIDSFFGSTCQALYRCEYCGELTEKRIHHCRPATLVKGNRYVTNNFVNLISNVLTVAIGCTVFLF